MPKDSLKILNQVLSQGNSSLSQEEVGKGLKSALLIGISKGVLKVGKNDGYFKNPKLNIPLPKEVSLITSTLSKVGLSHLSDKAQHSLNRAAEKSAQLALPLFKNALSSLTFLDALKILTSGKGAATAYLKQKTHAQLLTLFKPHISSSLKKVDATKYWGEMMGAYNKIPFVKRINPDLNDYVAQRALSGLFIVVAEEENKIRNNPAARTTALLQKVFSMQDNK